VDRIGEHTAVSVATEKFFGGIKEPGAHRWAWSWSARCSDFFTSTWSPTVLRVRIPLAPPFSLPSQRLRARTRNSARKLRDSAGSWASGPRVPEPETAGLAPQEDAVARVFSGAKLGGPGSLSIRPRVPRAPASRAWHERLRVG